MREVSAAGVRWGVAPHGTDRATRSLAPDGTWRWALGLILVVAFAVRLYLVTGPSSWQPYTIDSTTGRYIMRGMRLSGAPGPMYDRVARNFLAGRGLVNEPGSVTPTRAPLYPLILAGMYSLVDEPLLPIGILHALLGTVTCLLVWQAARMMSSNAVGLLAAGITAVMPEFLKYTPRLYASTLLVFLTAAFVVAVFAARRRKSAWWSVLPGLLLGLVALTRLELLVLLPAVLIWQLLDGGTTWRQRLARCTLMTAGLALVVSPWLIYNRTTSVDELADAGGGSLGNWLWGHNNPYAQTVWEDPPTGPGALERGLGAVPVHAARDRIQAELGSSDPKAVEGYFKQRAIEFILAHPIRVAELVVSRLMLLWNLWPTPPPPLPAFLAYWAFLGVALVGIVLTWRQPETRLLVFMLIAVTLFYSFIHGHPRYRLPATVTVIMLFAVGATQVWNRLRRGTGGMNPARRA
ncbi:MAG: glycosyltransferase family 39 protein [Armatimonadota bacterium]|nr:glycosyltransferase family 39 protein [Armatimonadota bacterium]